MQILLLNVYYFIMSVYGWYNWVQKKDDTHYTYPISWCNKKELGVGIGFFLFFWAVIYVVLTKANKQQYSSFGFP